jgi:hypothetical protein
VPESQTEKDLEFCRTVFLRINSMGRGPTVGDRATSYARMMIDYLGPPKDAYR